MSLEFPDKVQIDTTENGQAVINGNPVLNHEPFSEVNQSKVSVWQKIRECENKNFDNHNLFVDLIWDVSGSLKHKQNGFHQLTKIQESVIALRHILSASPLNTNFAFRIMGQDPNNSKDWGTYDTKTALIVPFGENNLHKIAAYLETITPQGNSNMATTLRAAANEEIQTIDPANNDAVIIAVTDGEIADPRGEAKLIRDRFPRVRIVLVYLDNELCEPQSSSDEDGITVIHASSMPEVAKAVQRIVETEVKVKLLAPGGALKHE
jgi:hypothetical protein